MNYDNTLVKIMRNYEDRLLAGMIEFTDKRFTWLNAVKEDYLLSHESRMIYSVIKRNSSLNKSSLMVEVYNDGIANNYNTERFLEFVEMEAYLCNDDTSLKKIIQNKRFRDLKTRFDDINPLDPQEETIQALYETVNEVSIELNCVSSNKCFTILGKEMMEKDPNLMPRYTGDPVYDDAFNGFLEGMHVVSGRAGAGKTTFVIQKLAEFAQYNPDLNVVFFSGEVGMRSISQKIASFFSGIDINKIKKHQFTEEEFKRFSEASDKTPKNFHVVECNQICSNEVLEFCRKMEKETGKKVGLIGVDYLQIMRPNDINVKSEADWYGKISADFREFSKIYPMFMISNLTKEKDGSTCPTEKELKGSSQIEYDASSILMLWRPIHDQPQVVCSKILKNRFGTPFLVFTWRFIGPIGKFFFENYGMPIGGSKDNTRPF